MPKYLKKSENMIEAFLADPFPYFSEERTAANAAVAARRRASRLEGEQWAKRNSQLLSEWHRWGEEVEALLVKSEQLEANG